MDVFGSALFNSPVENAIKSATPTIRSWRDMDQTVDPETEQSILAVLGQAGLSGASWVGEQLDKYTLSRALRGALGGEFRELLSPIPFSDELGITDPADRVTGKDLVRQYAGIQDDPNAWSDDIAGFATEALLDPTLPLTLGTGSALSGAGKLAKAAGVLGDATAAAAAKAGVQIGSKAAPGVMASRVGQTLRELLANAPDPTVQTRILDTARRQGLLDSGAIPDALLDQKLSGLAGVGIPFRDPSFVFGNGETGQAIARGLDSVGSFAYNMPYSPLPVARALFDSDVKGMTSPEAQALAAQASQGERRSIFDARQKIAGLKQALDSTGWLSGETAQANRLDLIRYLEGIPGNPLPPEVLPIADQIKALGPDILNAERSAGLKSAELQDEFAKYIPRLRRTFADEAPQRTTGGRTVDTTNPFQTQREGFLRNLPGGTALLDQIAMDKGLSGLLKRENYRNKVLPPELRTQAREHLISTYGPQLGDIATKRPQEFEQLVSWATSLDPRFADKQVPYFADPLEGYLSRLETSQRAQGNANLIGDIFSGAAKLSDETKFDEPTQTLGKSIQAMGGLDFVPFGQNLERRLAESGRFENLSQLQDEALQGIGEGDVARAFRAAAAQRELELPADLFDANGVLDPSKLTPELAPLYERSRESLRLSGLLNRFVAPTKITDDATQMMQRFTQPKAAGALEDGLRKVTNLTKFGLTSPWAAFQSRNLLSGDFNNAVAGAYRNPIDLGATHREAHLLLSGGTIPGAAKTYEPYVGAGKTDEQATDILRQLSFAADLVSPANQAVDAVDGASLRMPGKENPVTLLGGFKPNPELSWLQAINPLGLRGVGTVGDTNYVARAANQVGNWTEGQNRVSPFLGYLRQGLDPQEAARRVKDAQVDYSRATDFEKKLKLLIPFYSFTRGQIPFVAEQLAAHPAGALAQTVRGQGRIQRENEFTPESVAGTTAIPLGEDDGNLRFLTGLGLGFEDPLSLIRPGSGPYDAAQNTFSELAGRLNPLIKMPLEIAAGRQFFSGRDLEDLDSGIGRIASNIGLTEQPPEVPILLDQLLANSPLSRAASTLRTATDQRKWDYALPLNLATGLKISDVPEEKSASVAMRNAIEELLRGSNGVYTTRANLFVTPEDYALMSPFDQQLYLKYRELQSAMRN